MVKSAGKVLTVLFSLVIGFLIAMSPVQVAEAAEGTQFNVGMLVDEAFEHFDADLGTPGLQAKISGWEVYATGGTFTYEPWHWFKITDNSASNNFMLKKRFASQTSGKITFYYRFNMPTKMDGMAWQLNNGDVVGVNILTSGGNLCYESSSGSAVTLQSYNANTDYGVKVVADMSTKTANIYVNGVSRATGVAFRNSVSNLNYVLIKTGNSQTGDVYLSPVRVYKGYDIYEDFESTLNNVPADWTVTGSGGTVTANQWKTQQWPDIYSIKLDDTSTSNNKAFTKSFNAKNVKSVFEYYFILPSKVDGMAADISNKKTIKVKMKNNTTSTTGQIYFITDADTTWNEAKHKDFTIVANDGNYTEYVIDMSSVSGWTGTLKQLRVDPQQGVSSGSFSIDYVRIDR